ncbi:phage regulatory CII family protein [Gilvimarinus agarilyticus]|uniref:phage regulatory CII family protein n=1 Tax=Gilvimarinus agarilyticus TaxID=679259 RepID=UPI0005A286D7|nr:phage regulatory CII family protein [Gilvimarinus agarilyticus]
MNNENNDSCLSLEIACYQAVRSFPGGVPAVAGAFGWNPRTLQNKLNPTQDTHKLTAVEVEGILQLTRDGRVLDALCAQYGAIWVDIGRVKNSPSDMAMLDNITETVTRVGELSRKVQESLADGVVDAEEMAQLERAVMRMCQGGFMVLERAKQFM